MPSDLTAFVYHMPNAASLCEIFRPMLAVDAVHTDLVAETPLPLDVSIEQTAIPNPPTARFTRSGAPEASADKSCTYKVRCTVGKLRKARSMMVIMASRILYVAKPDPAVIPLPATMVPDKASPTLSILRMR